MKRVKADNKGGQTVIGCHVLAKSVVNERVKEKKAWSKEAR